MTLKVLETTKGLCKTKRDGHTFAAECRFSRCVRVYVCVCSCLYFYGISLSELMSMCLYFCVFSLNGTSALNWPLNAVRCTSGFASYKCRKTKRARELQSGWVTFQAFHLQSTICFCSSSLSIIIYIFFLKDYSCLNT